MKTVMEARSIVVEEAGRKAEGWQHSAGEQAYKVQQERKGSSSKPEKRGRADGNVERETRGAAALARKEAAKVHQGKPREEGTQTAAKKAAQKERRHIGRQ